MPRFPSHTRSIMKAERSTSVLIIITVVLLTILHSCFSVSYGNGCPPPEDIAPCLCFNGPYPVLECEGILKDEILEGVFKRSKAYNYKQVYLKYSTIKYFPKELFEDTEVQELYIQNSTLNALFDSPPEGLHNLYKIHLENTKITELTHWELLQPLTHLQILNVYYNTLESIHSSFKDYVTKNLAQITFFATGTKHFAPGVFVEFTNLNKVAFDKCKIKEISRGIFPRPFNVQTIYFNNNELSEIPDDMFTDMPRLHTVGLRDNLLTTIPESAFGGKIRELTYLFLNGNPLKCSCPLLWLISNKPENLGGSCATPIYLHNRELKDLTPKSFKC